MKKKILENSGFLIGIITVLLIVIFQKSISIAAIIAGSGFALYGVCAFLLGDKRGYVFTGIGVSLVSAMFIYKFDILPKFESITLFICLSMVLIVFLAFLFEIYGERELKKTHRLVVDAKVIDLVKNPNTKKEFYQPLYESLQNGNYVLLG